jgi:hypothetical protein
MVASAVLSAVLALAAVPGLTGSPTLSPNWSLEAAGVQSAALRGPATWPITAGGPLDAADRSQGHIEGATYLEEPGEDQATPASKSSWAWKEPLYTLTGIASYYNAGYTAMRLPRGTIIVVCGAAACLERVINDYGPGIPERIIDLYKPDFFTVCGCGWWEGLTEVTVMVYT